MSAKGNIQKNSNVIQPSMKHGEEPTALLLALVWSAVSTLLERGLAEVFTGDGSVAIVIANSQISTGAGLIQAIPPIPEQEPPHPGVLAIPEAVPTLPEEEVPTLKTPPTVGVL